MKKDITPVTGSVSDMVMADLDKMNPYLYRYNEETDQMEKGKEAKFRSGVHMGLILDETPDYIQSSSYTGMDIYAVATLGVAAGKYNRDEIKQIKESIGLTNETMTVQDFGSIQMSGTEKVVTFSENFSSSLNGALPVITVTSNTPGVTLSIVEKTATGFKVVSSASAVSFDYIAMAKVKNTMVEKREAVPAATLQRMQVSAGEKAQVQNYWNSLQTDLKASEEKARQDAVGIQQQRAAEIAKGQVAPVEATFDVKADAAAKAKKAEEAKALYQAVPENAPAKNLANPNPSKEGAPKSANQE
jgi:hypothetical protein